MSRRVSLRGRTVLITSGPTRESLDPVRFLTNASSGAMGFALAAAARDLGARVCVVSGPATAAAPRGVDVVPVVTALQMLRAVRARARRADLVIAAAAVSDWRFTRVSRHKLKRRAGALRLTVVPNPDIIRDAASRRRPGQVFVGFALETRRAAQYARAKLVAKGLDLVVANGPENLASGRARATLITRQAARAVPEGTKARVARAIVAAAASILEHGE
ncbi:MAG: phosphopantothenoylcysteine decarboxylase [Elusimicrobia bacterium]|nr:phosphopantothenoylcysteine decarboxylase [Elusimicrobiota bacterium]